MGTKESAKVRTLLKENFDAHADSILEWISKKDFKEIKNYLWRLIMSSNEYAYAKGYNTGRKTGFAEGIAHKISEGKP